MKKEQAERLKAIRTRLKGISSPAPWSVFRAEVITIDADEGPVIVDQVYAEGDEEAEARDRDAEFIAHAPSDIAFLLRLVWSSGRREGA